MNKRGDDVSLLVVGNYILGVLVFFILLIFVYTRATASGIDLQVDAYDIAFVLNEMANTDGKIEVIFLKRDEFVSEKLDLDYDKGKLVLRAKDHDDKKYTAEAGFFVKPGVKISFEEVDNTFVFKRE